MLLVKVMSTPVSTSNTILSKAPDKSPAGSDPNGVAKEKSRSIDRSIDQLD